MSTGRKVLIFVCFVGIFCAGGATGAFVALRVVKHMAGERGLMSTFVPRQMARMTEELNLTPDQKEKINSILQQGAGEISTLRRESIRESASKIREMNQKISALLTPEQAAKFEELLKRQRERIRKFQMERAERRAGEDGARDEPPPPPPPSSNP